MCNLHSHHSNSQLGLLIIKQYSSIPTIHRPKLLDPIGCQPATWFPFHLLSLNSIQYLYFLPFVVLRKTQKLCLRSFWNGWLVCWCNESFANDQWVEGRESKQCEHLKCASLQGLQTLIWKCQDTQANTQVWLNEKLVLFGFHGYHTSVNYKRNGIAKWNKALIILKNNIFNFSSLHHYIIKNAENKKCNSNMLKLTKETMWEEEA